MSHRKVAAYVTSCHKRKRIPTVRLPIGLSVLIEGGNFFLFCHLENRLIKQRQIHNRKLPVLSADMRQVAIRLDFIDVLKKIFEHSCNNEILKYAVNKIGRLVI